MPRKKRKYEEYITVGFNENGARILKFICADSKPEFERKKYEAKREAELVRSPSEITFGNYAAKWFEIYKSNLGASTRSVYSYALKKTAPISMMQLKAVKTSDLQQLINNNIEYPKSCQILKRTLQQIYKQAIKDGIIYPLKPCG